MTDALKIVLASVRSTEGITRASMESGGMTSWEHDEARRLVRFLSEFQSRVEEREAGA